MSQVRVTQTALPGSKDRRARAALRALGLGRVGAVRVHDADARTRGLVRQASGFVTDRRV